MADTQIPDVAAQVRPTQATAGAAAVERALRDDQNHVFHSWSAQAHRTPMLIAGGEGCWVWDGGGRRYLDFSSQLVNTNIGHQHPRVVRAIQEQASRLCTVAPQHANDMRSEAARLIAGLAPAGRRKVFFTNGGTEAVEHACRMARLHTGRIKLLSAYRSYHGATTTSIHLTGDSRRWASDYGSAGVAHFFGPFVYRSPFGATNEDEECARALRHLADVIAFEGPATIAAVVLETVPGTAGIMPPPRGYLKGVRELCDEHGIVYIADEVMAGFGRSGSWFAFEQWDVVPDLITFAKGITSGYVPLGGVIISDEIAATFEERVYPGGLTYSGHPLACATAVATITAMRDERIVDNAACIGREVLGPSLRELAARHSSIGDVRGLGVFWCLELVSDRTSKRPLSEDAMAATVRACLDNGLLPFSAANRIHVVPPCIISHEEVRQGIAMLDDALNAADSSLH